VGRRTFWHHETLREHARLHFRDDPRHGLLGAGNNTLLHGGRDLLILAVFL